MRFLFCTRRARRWGARPAPIFFWVLMCGLVVSDVGAREYTGRVAAQEVINTAALAGVDAQWSAELLGAAERQQSILDEIARPA